MSTTTTTSSSSSSSTSSQNFSELIISQISNYVAERDKELKEARKEVESLKKKMEDMDLATSKILEEYKDELSSVTKVKDKLTAENLELKTDLEKHKQILKQIIDEHAASFRSSTVLMTMIRDRMARERGAAAPWLNVLAKGTLAKKEEERKRKDLEERKRKDMEVRKRKGMEENMNVEGSNLKENLLKVVKEEDTQRKKEEQVAV